MKIGIDIRPLMDEQYSGVSEYTKNLLAGILSVNEEKMRHDIVLYYNSGRSISAKMEKFADDGSKLVYTSYPNKVFNYILQKALRYPKIDRLAGGADLFFMPHINFAALSSGAKLILTVHDLSFLRYPEFFSVRKNIWHHLNGFKRLIRRADIVVAISESTKRDLIELLGVPDNKIEVIHSGIDRSLFREIDDPERTRVRKKYGLPERYVLYLGTIEPRKNLVGIIEAFRDYTRTRGDDCCYLVLAGRFGWKTDKIKEAINKSPVKNRIKLLGYVDNEDKPGLYGLAQALFYPSFYEGFGFPALEALASGASVIIGRNSSLPEIAGRYGIMVDPYDTAELTQALVISLDNSAYKQSFRENKNKIKDEIAKEFDWNLTASRYCDLFGRFHK